MSGCAVFELVRTEDVTGVSGTGTVAHGCVFPDGTVALRWAGDVATTVLYDCLGDVTTIHGHHGATTVRMLP